MNLELMKKIVDSAPDGSTHYWDYPASGLCIDYYKVAGDFISVWAYWLDSPIWIRLTDRIYSFKIKPL